MVVSSRTTISSSVTALQVCQVAIHAQSINHQLYYSKTERDEVQQLTRRTALYTL